jgi:hypothetical protein
MHGTFFCEKPLMQAAGITAFRQRGALAFQQSFIGVAGYAEFASISHACDLRARVVGVASSYNDKTYAPHY